MLDTFDHNLKLEFAGKYIQEFIYLLDRYCLSCVVSIISLIYAPSSSYSLLLFSLADPISAVL